MALRRHGTQTDPAGPGAGSGGTPPPAEPARPSAARRRESGHPPRGGSSSSTTSSAARPRDSGPPPASRPPLAVHQPLEIQVFAGMRSGHHAIVHWLLCHFDGPVLFRNNPLGAGHSVYRNADAGYMAADALRPQPKDCYVFNVEDRTIEEIAAALAERREHLAWGTSGRVVRLLVVRDLPNFIASRLKADGVTIPAFMAEDWSGLWASHARELAGATATFPDLVKVSYNAWATDAAYRRALAARLDLRFTDAGRDFVPRIGAGSSFDGRRYDGRGREMAVLERYREVEADPEYPRLHRRPRAAPPVEPPLRHPGRPLDLGRRPERLAETAALRAPAAVKTGAPG